MKKLSNSILALGLCLFLGITTLAQSKKTKTLIRSEIWVEIDCNDSALEHENTANKITVELYNGSTKLATIDESFSTTADFFSNSDWSFRVNKPRPMCDNISNAIYAMNIKDREVPTITHAMISTDGNDGFWMDFVELVRYDLYTNKSETEYQFMNQKEKASITVDSEDKTVLATWGRNGGMGFCLSTDPNDASGDWKPFVDGSCYSKIKFDVASGNAYPVDRGEGTVNNTGYVSVFNQGGYVLEVVMTYLTNQAMSDGNGGTIMIPMPIVKREKLSVGQTFRESIPADATAIALSAEGIACIDKLDFAKTFSKGAGLQKCYKTWGTIFDVEYDEVNCN